MDFSYDEEQEAVRELAARIFGDLATPERLKEVVAGSDHVDHRLWKEFASAGLLAVALPESCGGAGLGLMAAGIVAEECGRVAAAVPYSATVVGAAMPIARFGSDDQRRRWVEPILSGQSFLTAALCEARGDVWQPVTQARRHGGEWRLEGTKSYVPAASVAGSFVVSATDEDGRGGLFVVDRDAPGVSVTLEEPTDGRIEGELELDGAVVGGDAVIAAGPDRGGALEWLVERLQAVTCLEIAGACQTAVKLTAEYTTTRNQFGKPIATFQAVGQRAADAFIDTEGVRLTAWHAAWRLSEDLPSAAEVAVAKFWADDGAQRVVHAAQHLHGGIGVDRDYPLHRYFLLVKHLALVLGGSAQSLVRLGDHLASEPA